MKHSHILFLIFVLACSKQKKQQANNHQLKIIESKGYVVPKDSITEPKSVFVNEQQLKKISLVEFQSTLANSNVYPIGKPKIIIAGTPKINIPGKDNFSLPTVIKCEGKINRAGIPEIVIAKDPYAKEQNPQSFSSFAKLQGLKHGNINCLLEDKNNNIWFGTYGGGVSKYDGKFFTHFTEKEGLSNNDVRSMLEDRDGNIWFGTYGGGISKYDGKYFTNYTAKEGLSSNEVLSILEDRNGNIWFATNGGGVLKYDGEYFTNYTTKEGLSNNEVLSILEDRNGNIWFGTFGGGVSKYDGKYFANYTTKEGLSDNFIFTILEDKNGNIWLGTNDKGIIKYDGKYFSYYTTKEGLGGNIILSTLEDKSGNIWFGTYDGGVTKYDGKHFTHFTEKEGLSINKIWSLLEDKNGNIWFGTYGGGVSKYNGTIFTHFTEKEGLSNNEIVSVIQDNKGNMWFGSYGGGISKYDGKSFTHFIRNPEFELNDVRCILEDKYDNIWFGTFGNGIIKHDGKRLVRYGKEEGLNNDKILSILEDKIGNIWFGTNGGGALRYNGKSFTSFTEKEGLSSNDIRSMLEDKNGNIWFGSNGGGLTKYDGKYFTHFTEKEGLSANFVLSMLKDKNDNIWIGTNGAGIFKYDGKCFTNFTEKEGLSNNVVLSMLEDKNGSLWFGTRFGLSKLTTSRLTALSKKIQDKSVKEQDVFFKNYTYEDGFLGIGCKANSICEAKDGTIWIGTNDRLTAYHPPALDAVDTIAPKIELINIDLYNENIPWIRLENKKDTILTLGNGVNISNVEFDGLTNWYNLPQNLSFAYNNNYLSFNFIGITMMQPKKVKYQYKLEGIDENWSALTSRTEVAYGNILPGNYTFKVKAMNSEGYWSNEFKYTFKIRPPWWKTWWALTLWSVIIVGSVIFYIKRREYNLKQRQRELEQTVEEITIEVEEEKKVIEKQKNEIEEKHKEITDSINYAERIQRALLASKKLLDENLSNYFILFKPKDVVSGDFYWATKMVDSSGVENFILLTADSTGHGVPGAIMSILNVSCIKEASLQGIESPDLLLNETRRLIIENLKNDGSEEGGKDGMDGSLLSFDFKNNSLKCAAANNPIWIIRSVSSSGVENQTQLIEIKADRFPIGKHDRDQTPFTLHTLNLQKGDVIYTFTDGYSDQFGGPEGKKFKHKQLQEVLLKVANEPMETQKQKLNNVFDTWKGNLEQVDDVCLIGVKI